ncbi:MAG: hypothetical protein H6612_03920 [Ignavibacteriales bacterium]|nr:hypothetical protein [Ignavibacteriales bacterium]
MVLAQVRKNNSLYRLTKFRFWYHVHIYHPNGGHSHFSYKSYKKAAFIFSNLTGHSFNNQLNLF